MSTKIFGPIQKLNFCIGSFFIRKMFEVGIKFKIFYNKESDQFDKFRTEIENIK